MVVNWTGVENVPHAPRDPGIARDARRLSSPTLENLRRRAVGAVESGVPQAQVARVYGVSRKTVGTWVRAYRTRGEDSFHVRKRGRRSGDQTALSAAQQAEVVEIVTTSAPEAGDLSHQVWTRQAVADLISRRFQIVLTRATVSEYLVRWRLVPAAAVLHALRQLGPGERPLLETAAPHWIPAAPVLWVMWWRPEAVSSDVTELYVLLAIFNRGEVFFRPSVAPYRIAHVWGFLERLQAQLGRSMNAVIRSWPEHELSKLITWQQPCTDAIAVQIALHPAAPYRHGR